MNGMMETVEFRPAYFDRTKKRYFNACNRIKIKLKIIKRIKPLTINGKTIYRVYLHDFKSLEESPEFSGDNGLHGNGGPRHSKGSISKPLELLDHTDPLHDKKDFRAKQSGIEYHSNQDFSRTVRNILVDPQSQLVFPQKSFFPLFTFEDLRTKMRVGENALK